MNRIEAPELFNDPKTATPGRSGEIKSVEIPVSPEGVYIGNGQYKDPGTIFRIVGFDKDSNGEIHWRGRGYIKK